MAEIAYTTSRKNFGRLVVTWTDVTESDTAQTFTFNELPQDISLHTSGTFGGATVVYKVANDSGAGVNGTDLGGTAISVTAEDLSPLRERPISIKPTMSGGTSQTVDVTMVVWL